MIRVDDLVTPNPDGAVPMPFSPQCLIQPGSVFFDVSKRDPGGQRSLLFSAPVAVLSIQRTEELPWLLSELDRAVSEGLYAAGYMDYEAGYAFEAWEAVEKTSSPLAWFGLYDTCEIVAAADVASMFHAKPQASTRMSPPVFSLGQTTYRERIERIKQHIRRGDVYQINFTGAFFFDYDGSAIDLYRILRKRQSVSYGAVISHDTGHILSFSPELFFEREGRSITTRPMKGTIGRGQNVLEDQRLGDWLVNDEKNRAENVMIVDLLRNDLSRICEVGSVKVPALYSLETYETLFQMTSTVTGTLRDDITSAQLFEALYPGGSITGAPKLRAMEIIRDLEEGPRGIYCGAIGYLTPARRAVFNIAIRTLALENGKGRMGAGSGIVWDSDPDSEYQECLLKGKFLRIDEE